MKQGREKQLTLNIVEDFVWVRNCNHFFYPCFCYYATPPDTLNSSPIRPVHVHCLHTLSLDDFLLLTLAWFFPIWAMTFWVGANTRLSCGVTRNPFMPASETMEHPYLFLFFIHNTSISLQVYVVKYFIINILLKVLTRYVICNILL